MVEVLLFHRSLHTFLTDHWKLNYVPQQFANLSQSDRIASYRGVALTQCCRIDCSPTECCVFHGKDSNMELHGNKHRSRFVSKVMLPEHSLSEFYSPRARLEVPSKWLCMIQKVCAVFDLCGLSLVFDGSKRAASFGEVCVIPVRHWP